MVPGNVKSILGVLRGAFVAANRDGEITAVNTAAGELLGWPRSELIGAPISTIIPMRMREAHHKGFGHFLQTGQSSLVGRPVRVPAVGKDGKERDVDLTVLAYEDASQEIIIVAGLNPPDGVPLDLLHLEAELKASNYRALIAPGKPASDA